MSGRQKGARGTASWAAVAVSVFGLLPACGDNRPAPAPLDSVSSCSAAWQPILTLPGYDITSPLAYRDGVLYYSTFATQALTALPTGGGAGTTLATGYMPELWLDGDQLIYTGGDRGNLIYSVPVAGGSPTLLLDSAAGRSTSGIALHHDFNATDFYWAEDSSPDGATTVWRASRAGGTPVQIGLLTALDPGFPSETLPFMAIALSADAVLMAADLGVSYAVPFDGSAPRLLATADPLTKAKGNLAGLDPAGVYWTVPRAGASAEDDEWSVALAPTDGSPMRTFWQGTPAHSGVMGMWPTGDGAWILGAIQLFDDQRFHLVVWMLAPDGTSQRLACSPAEDFPVIQVKPAVTPDAVYVVASATPTQIVRIPR